MSDPKSRHHWIKYFFTAVLLFWLPFGCLVVFSIGPSSATVRTRLSLSFLIQIFHDVGLQNVLSNSVEPWGHPVAS